MPDHTVPDQTACASGPLSPSYQSVSDCPFVTFDVEAAADPGLLPRALEIFAKIGAAPKLCTARENAGDMAIRLVYSGLSHQQTHTAGERLRQILGVHRVACHATDFSAERHFGEHAAR